MEVKLYEFWNSEMHVEKWLVDVAPLPRGK
jgi:hypothetical protein